MIRFDEKKKGRFQGGRGHPGSPEAPGGENRKAAPEVSGASPLAPLPFKVHFSVNDSESFKQSTELSQYWEWKALAPAQRSPAPALMEGKRGQLGVGRLLSRLLPSSSLHLPQGGQRPGAACSCQAPG